MILFQVWPDSENQRRIYWLALTIDWPSRTCLATNAVSRARPPSSGQRLIQGEGWGGCNPPFGKFSNLSGYPCLSLFNAKNNIISYNVSSSQIDRYKNTVAIPLLDTLIMQMQGRFSDEDRQARHLLCVVPPPPRGVVPSIIANKALQLDDEVEGMLSREKDHIPFLKSLGN